jgi:hypothetical protein
MASMAGWLAGMQSGLPVLCFYKQQCSAVLCAGRRGGGERGGAHGTAVLLAGVLSGLPILRCYKQQSLAALYFGTANIQVIVTQNLPDISDSFV